MKYLYDDIESIELVDDFQDEYVYDIEVCDDTHTFIGNDILVHNSLYMSYEGLLNTIEGVEDMSIEEKTELIVRINTEFLDKHNQEFIKEYYNTRHGKSIHEFELETVALSGVWLDVKKRYAQILLWKDGKYYDMDSLPLKVKGLEMIKASYPKQAREGLKRIVRYFLELQDKEYLIQKLNIKIQEEKQLWMEAEIEDICENKSVQGYAKYIIKDDGNRGLIVAPKCPYNVRALGNYNYLRQLHNLPGDPLYGGKVKIYQIKATGKTCTDQFFAFQSKNYPSWATQYAPIDKLRQFEKYFLDPFNRILEAIGLQTLTSDGNIQLSLF